MEAAQRRKRFALVAGPGQLHAAVLALLLTPGRAREMAVWRDECRHTVGAKELRNELMKVEWPERMPWLEWFVARVGLGPLDKRQQLLRAVRRLIAADGRTLAIDRLRWLAIRHALGDVRALARPAAAEVELEGLATETALQIGRFGAFLSRIVPAPEIDLDVVSGAATSGERWWREVMQPWPDAGATRDMPDANALVSALHDVQALPWMLQAGAGAALGRCGGGAVACRPAGRAGRRSLAHCGAPARQPVAAGGGGLLRRGRSRLSAGGAAPGGRRSKGDAAPRSLAPERPAQESQMVNRRVMLERSAKVAHAAGRGGLLPTAAQAAWSQAAFEAKTLADAVKALGGAAPGRART